MQRLKIAAGFVNQTPLDWDGNLQNILDVVKEAEAQAVCLLCLPELCLTGYGCEDAFLSCDVQKRALDQLYNLTGALARLKTDMVVCVGLPLMYHNALYNVVAVLRAGKILGFIPKQHLANDGLHYEARWFKPWPAGHKAEIFGGVPIGDLLFAFANVRIGFEICEDAWVAQRPGGTLAAAGADLILNPSASHFAFGKHDVRTRFVTEGSRAFNCTYVYANLCGNEAGRAIYDGECMVATGGEVVAQGTRFSMKRWGLTTAVVDIDATRTLQAGTASFSPSFNKVPEVSSYHLYSSKEKGLEIAGPLTPKPSPDRFVEVEQALTLALFDYMLKSRTSGFAISLSGGADSAACAVLVRMMVERAVSELGATEFVSQMHLDYDLGKHPTMEAVTNLLLTCFYQGTRNSSDTTLNAATKVAEELAAKFLNLDVDAIVEAYKAVVCRSTGYTLDWKSQDLALQNIQARVRAPSGWLIANMENKLLVTTSNRSEAAVGYCTMDGDTAGSIAPIGGIDKTLLLQWLTYLAKDRYPSLWLIVDQKPTAELRPGAQTDEADLMPYPILQDIETCAIQQKKSPSETYDTLEAKHELTTQLLFSYIKKFYTLWCRNQWKRERYALSFHVDNRNLDPRSWCRFPVLNGGYTKELEELRSRLGVR